MWHSEELDLDAYLAHIGYEGDCTPTLGTLRTLQRAHVLSIGWENLDAFLHGHVALDVATIQDKLLHRGRGGYCYEHVTLFAAALEALGYRFTAVSGRIRMGSDKILPATHAMLVVELEGRRWLCDVGFGASLFEPIELADGAALTTGAWEYRVQHEEITPGADGWAVYQRSGDSPDGWLSRHATTLNPQYPIDFAVGNHFVDSNGRSPFVTRPFIQRILPDRLHILDGLTWTTQLADGSIPPKTQTVRAEEVRKLLDDVFGVVISDEDAALLETKLTGLAANGA